MMSEGGVIWFAGKLWKGDPSNYLALGFLGPMPAFSGPVLICLGNRIVAYGKFSQNLDLKQAIAH